MNKALLFFITLPILISSLAPGGHAATEEKKSLINRIKTRAAEVDTFSCEFRQERHLKIFSRPVVFKGRLLVDRPDKLRWEFTSPVPSVLVLNNNRGFRCSPEGRKQEFNLDSDPVMALIAEQLWSWLSGDYQKLQKHYRITGQSSPPALTITPKEAGTAEIIEEIRIQFQPRILHPSSITILEPGGDRTLLFFSNYKLNKAFTNSLFLNCRGMAGENDCS
ncbi:MAG: outer membrane lipoprotein carrier protein LolA [Desulfobia sp.]